MNRATKDNRWAAHRRWLMGLILLIIGAGVLATLLLPQSWQSEMRIPAAPSGAAEVSAENLNAEIALLQSRDALEAMARRLGRVNPAQLAERLSITAGPQPGIIQVNYRSADQAEADAVLNELHRRYIAQHPRPSAGDHTTQIFRTRSESANKQLNASTTALKQFYERQGTMGKAAQQDVLLQQFQQVQGQLNQTAAELAETRQRSATLKAQLVEQPERVEAEVRTKYSAARDKYKEEISRLEVHRAWLLQRQAPESEPVTAVEKRIAGIRELLVQEEKSPPMERTTVLNETHRRLTDDLLAAQTDLAALNNRQKSLTALAVKYEAQGKRLGVKGLELTDLERARTVSEDDYLAWHKGERDTEITNLLNQGKTDSAPAINHQRLGWSRPLIFAVLVGAGLLAALAFSRRNRRVAAPSITERLNYYEQPTVTPAAAKPAAPSPAPGTTLPPAADPDAPDIADLMGALKRLKLREQPTKLKPPPNAK